MRQPLIRRASPGVAKAQPITLPSPFGGINGIDALAGGMEPTDAVDMVNFFPIDGGIETRGGYTIRHDLRTGAPVLFLQDFDDGDERTIAASGGKLFRIAGAVTELASGFQSDRWRHAIMNDRLFLVNGFDAPRAVVGAAVVTPAFTGIGDARRLFRVRSHAKRLFFAERGSASFWYGGLNAVQGELKSFDLSGIGNRGGTIEEIATLAPDGGQGGDDDAIVFFMTSGEAIVYRGSSPDDAMNWGRVGVFPVARPIVAESHAGDVLTASLDGYAELSRVLASGRSPVAGFGRRMGRLALSAARSHGRNLGWQIVYHPLRQMILVNVPETATSSQQHVCNLSTGAWSRFRGLPASVWGHVGDDLCFGTPDGRIATYGAFSDGGSPIVAFCQGAWSTLGVPGRKKKVGLVKPFVTSVSTPMARHLIGADFRNPGSGAVASLPVASDIGIWDQSVWDRAAWSGAERVTAEFRGGGINGEFISVGLRVDTSAGPVKWLATTLMAEIGA
ncbi:hypothetical protein [Aureimonas mangrovi]|uniref:hypothetical protein n=1 Tax=Aureimonas mangrovi TaxID=2758041 RepID=UPI00163DA625|nr:hypothetical protein [Aureimonas mangrovi]